jgi:DNA polymerase bacteriophage-type
MRVLSIDIETYSDIDLRSCGVYSYAASQNFGILLFAYAFDDEPVQIVDIARGNNIPATVIAALFDKYILKTAYNANFERVCLSNFIHKSNKKDTFLDPAQWWCTSVHASMLGLPQNLGDVARVLFLKQQKMEEGKALIKYFCSPCKPTKKNGGRTRNLPEHDPEKWAIFKEYCKMDVEVERNLRTKLSRYPASEDEKKLWYLDQKINDLGVEVDLELIKNAMAADEEYRNKLEREAVMLTGLDNPQSVAQLKSWFKSEGIEVESLNKETVPELLKNASGDIARVLEIRQEISKTSIKKYDAMRRAVCPDGRVRGLLQFYGANRTGRWAGRIVQVQNLVRNDLDNLELARELIKDGRFEEVELLFGSVSNVLSQLVRTAFVAPEGYTFIVADFSAIEARVIAWLAGEQWRLDVFNTHGKIYEASASAMFSVPIESIGKGSPLRQKGKIAELALGYQGGKGALMAMGAIKMGLVEDELQGLVDSWRYSNPKIVTFWHTVGAAALKAVKEKTTVKIYRIKMIWDSGMLFIELPSGRKLAYARASIKINKFGSESLVYEGVDQTTKKWGQLETYGGKLVENIVQAVARDCLAEAMLRLDTHKYRTVMHVHDEVIIQHTEWGSESMLKHVLGVMGEPIPWAKGLPLKADGYITKFYKKD